MEWLCIYRNDPWGIRISEGPGCVWYFHVARDAISLKLVRVCSFVKDLIFLLLSLWQSLTRFPVQLCLRVFEQLCRRCTFLCYMVFKGFSPQE